MSLESSTCGFESKGPRLVAGLSMPLYDSLLLPSALLLAFFVRRHSRAVWRYHCGAVQLMGCVLYFLTPMGIMACFPLMELLCDVVCVLASLAHCFSRCGLLLPSAWRGVHVRLARPVFRQGMDPLSSGFKEAFLLGLRDDLESL